MAPCRIPSVFLLVSSCALSLPAQVAPRADQVSSGAVVAWIRQNAIPLRHVEAGYGFDDLQPLKSLLRNVRIVGLGESTHGTREFFQVKHRLLEFLIREMGFNAFAIEAAYSDAQPINDYVLYGRGDRDSVLTGQGYVAWDTEEFASMLDWLRGYNRTVPPAKKVRFYGLDLYRNEVGRRRVMAFLRHFAPEEQAAADSVFRLLAVEEGKWPLWDTTIVAGARPWLEALSEHITAKTMTGGASQQELDEILKHIQVMQQAALLEDSDRSMAENFIYLADHERPNAKFVLWAHNYHILTETSDSNTAHLGSRLRSQYGNQYFAIGFEFFRGSYNARLWPPPGDFRQGVLPDAPPGSLAWHLHRAGIGNFILDLRATPGDNRIGVWLHNPQLVHAVGWAYQDPSTVYERIVVGDGYDALLFIAESNPTHPTPNALRVASLKIGF